MKYFYFTLLLCLLVPMQGKTTESCIFSYPPNWSQIDFDLLGRKKYSLILSGERENEMMGAMVFFAKAQGFFQSNGLFDKPASINVIPTEIHFQCSSEVTEPCHLSVTYLLTETQNKTPIYINLELDWVSSGKYEGTLRRGNSRFLEKVSVDFSLFEDYHQGEYFILDLKLNSGSLQISSKADRQLRQYVKPYGGS